MPFLYLCGDKYIVMQSACFDYVEYKSKWMDDNQIGDNCLIPSLDLVENRFVFDNERDALLCMKNLWSQFTP